MIVRAGRAVSIVFGLMAGVFLCAVSGAGALRAQQAFQTPVGNAILMDFDSKSVLFEKNADQLVSPASLAKMMTAEIVFHELREGRLTLDRTFTVSENAWRRGGAPAGGSAMFAAVRSQIKLEDLLRGLIIMSGNDAAITIAEGIAGTEENFAGLMTRRARELGLDKMNFRNAWGKYDPEQKVTVRQLALLAEHIIRTYPEYYHIFGEKEFTWNKIKQQNRNPLLFMDIGADGLKTGNVEDSGFALVGSATENGQRVIVAIVGAKSSRERADEARKLLSWGLRSFESRPLFEANAEVGSASVFGGASRSVELVSEKPIKVLIPRGSSERLVAQIVYQGPLVAPVQQGAQVAKLRVTRGKALVLEAPLVAGASVAPGALHQRALDAGWELSLGLFNKYVLKK
ncbi:MAG: D-alanyl-D-alanine carboxypeptidase DacF [Hyphomicrobiales bacterium]|nr:D-alanyl-D-alanine carboxypeptidase DacF [Hyphomicrobiales bacterium]